MEIAGYYLNKEVTTRSASQALRSLCHLEPSVLRIQAAAKSFYDAIFYTSHKSHVISAGGTKSGHDVSVECKEPRPEGFLSKNASAMSLLKQVLPKFSFGQSFAE